METEQLAQTYAFLATGSLYLALLVSPLYSAFPQLAYKGLATKARRALGVSSFVFALFHVYLTFFVQLGGFAGLPFLDSTYIWAICLSSLALLILTLMAATSSDWAIRKLSFPRWKWLHRLVYLAGILIIIHALLLGSDFGGESGSLAGQVALFLLSILLMLEALRIDTYLARIAPRLPRLGLVSLIVLAIILLAPHYINLGGLSIHAHHADAVK